MAVKDGVRIEDLCGIRRKKYWTPDGREIMAIPSMHTLTKRGKDGKLTNETMVIDTNCYYKGWLTEPPTEPKIYCAGCDKWHDTQEEVDTCIAEKKRKMDEWNARSRKMLKKDEDAMKDDVENLKSEMGEIKDLLSKIIERL